MSNGLIDTHFHLDHYRNYLDVAAKINKLRQYTICVTNSPGVFLSCKNSITETQYLKFAIGYHPQNLDLSSDDLRDFLRLIDRTQYVGEIGLDFSQKSKMDKSQQLKAFDKIVEKSAAENKIMTIHIRGAENEAISILNKYSPRRAIIHWYTGSNENLLRLVDLGCYFSINSNMVLSKNNKKYLHIPKERLLVESDGPYTKIDGKKFNPSYLCQAYDLIGEFFNSSNLYIDVFDNFKLLCFR